MRSVSCTVLLVTSLLLGSFARADNKDVAREAYRDGTRLYDLADFKGALESFKKAYFNYEDPAFLFNIAQCYRQLGDAAEATRFYKTYLRKVPDAPNAEEVRRLIQSLEAAPPPAPATKSPPPPVEAPARPPASPAPSVQAQPHPLATASPLSAEVAPTLTRAAAPRRASVPAYKRWWVWTVVGVVAAGAATGLALGLTASHDQTLPMVHVP